MAPIGLALLGAGIFAKEAHLPALSILGSKIIELKAVYSRSKSSASSLAEASKAPLGLDSAPSVYSEDGAAEGNLDALLARSDIQAVIVLLPLTQQPEIVLRALAAGKNVLSEKPVAKDVKTGLALIEKWEKEYKPKGLIWRVAENFEVEPGLVEAARRVKAGAIGTVWSFNFSMIWTIAQDNKYYNTSWRTIPDYQGGFLLDGGVHATATLRLILPFSLGTSTVTGFSSLTRDHLKPHDTIQAVIQAQKTSDAYPPQGIFELSCAAPPGFGRYLFTVTGTEGNISITTVQKPASEADSAIAKARQSTNDENPNFPHVRVTITSGSDGKNVEEFDMIGCGVLKEIESFANAIAGQDDGNGNPRGALQDVALIQAFLDSSGRPVDIKQLLEKGNV